MTEYHITEEKPERDNVLFNLYLNPSMNESCLGAAKSLNGGVLSLLLLRLPLEEAHKYFLLSTVYSFLDPGHGALKRRDAHRSMCDVHYCQACCVYETETKVGAKEVLFQKR